MNTVKEIITEADRRGIKLVYVPLRGFFELPKPEIGFRTTGKTWRFIPVNVKFAHTIAQAEKRLLKECN